VKGMAVEAIGVRRDGVGPRSPGRSWFYAAMGAVAVAMVLIGFGPGVTFSPTKRHGPPSTFAWFHGLVAAMWLSLYIVQTLLARRPNTRAHRWLGSIGVPLAVAVVVTGYITTIAQGRRGFALWWDPALKTDPLAELVHPLGDLLSFSVLVTAALVWRRRSDVHKRLMLLATVGSLMAAPLAHFFGYFPALREGPPVILLPLAALYFSSAVYDRLAHGRIHPASLWAGLSLLTWAMFRGLVIGPSSVWHQLAGWLISP
jgi:hypothetical protein